MFNFKKIIPGAGVSLTDKMMFTKHLSLMLKAGLSLREGVATVKGQVASKRFKNILESIIARLDNGRSLSSALEEHSEVFSDLMINVIDVGEQSGTLQGNLFYLSDQLQKKYKLKRKIRAAMVYPALILTSTIGLAIGLAVFVLPRLAGLFKSMDFALPWPTRLLLWITNSFQAHGLLIAVGAVLLVVFLFLISRLRPVRKVNHWLFIKLPIIGEMTKNKNLAEFNRNMGVLLSSGVSMVKSFEIAKNSLGNLVYREKLEKVQDRIKAGESIASNLEKFPVCFPGVNNRMIAVGEKSGSLTESFSYLGDFYEDEVDSTVEQLSTILEPVLLILIAIMVGFVAVSIIMPIYELTGNLAR